MNICALKNPYNDFIMQNRNSIAEECYILHNRVKSKWIRSGKCIGRPITERLKEHKRHAELARDTTFYRSYLLGTIGYKGKYKWLDVHIG